MSERDVRFNPVKCVEDGHEFPSQTEACLAYGINLHAMGLHLRGFKENINGLHFVRTHVKIIKSTLMQVEGPEFASIEQAASAFNMSVKTAKEVLDNGLYHHNGIRFITEWRKIE